VDFDRMLSRVERRILRRRAGMKLALAGALALMLFAFASYFYYPTRQAANGGTLMSYVFEQESVDGPILDYVFSRNGTIFD
jgi:hypothetical protein